MYSIIHALVSVIIGTLLVIIYFLKYRGTPINVWKPQIAWVRAFIYFSLCNLVFAVSGTLDTLITQPIVRVDQITNPTWILYLVVCFLYIFFAYWILWSRMTLTFDRQYHLLVEILFGIIWGISTGGLLLSFYHLWSLTALAPWMIYLLSYLSLAIIQYFTHDYFWDVYVSPEHDTPRSIIIKTSVCHIPNVALSLGFLILWDNYAIFIFFFIFALTATTIFQKFPVPWAKGKFHAPMVKQGIFGLYRGAGYTKKTKPSKISNPKDFN